MIEVAPISWTGVKPRASAGYPFPSLDAETQAVANAYRPAEEIVTSS
jgi:hypothetical protein